MIDWLRALLDRPVDPRHARAVVVIASCVTVGFAILVGLGVIAGARSTDRVDREAPRPTRPTAPAAAPVEGSSAAGETSPPGGPTAPPVSPGANPSAGSGDRVPGTQDPQDDPESRAGRDAAGENASHRALQHVPYRRGPVSITLVGARRGKAIIRVAAGTERGAHAAWHRLLRRSGDDGHVYQVVFADRGSRHAR